MSMVQPALALARNGTRSSSGKEEVREYVLTEYREKDPYWIVSSCGRREGTCMTETDHRALPAPAEALPADSTVAHTEKRLPSAEALSANRLVKWLMPKVGATGRQ